MNSNYREEYKKWSDDQSTNKESALDFLVRMEVLDSNQELIIRKVKATKNEELFNAIKDWIEKGQPKGYDNLKNIIDTYIKQY